MSFLQTKSKRNLGFFVFGLTLTLLLALTITPIAYAGEYIEGEPNAVLNEGQVIQDDLFIAGDDVSIAGVVEGDLFAIGENVDISGTVNGDVFTAGQTVTVSGEIDGSLIIAGYDLTLGDGSSIRRNVYFAGFSFETMDESLIARSIYGGGYQMILGGNVVRDVTSALVALDVSGPVGGDISVEIGEPTDYSYGPFTFLTPGMPAIKVLKPGYTVDENQVDGEVSIKVSPIDTDIEPNITIDPGYFIMQRIRRRIGEFISLMLVGLLAIWLTKGTLLKAVEEVKKNAGMDSVWGIVVYLLYIPVVFILFLVLLALTLGVSLFTLGSLAGEIFTISSFSFFGALSLFGMMAGLATKVVISYLVGRWILEKASHLSFENYWHHVGALGIGVFLYELLRAIPFFGWMVMIVVVVIGTGAFAVMITNALRKEPPTSTEDVEASVTSDSQ
jgi:cytoskeletal protein CcmA (bactofilin family)